MAFFEDAIKILGQIAPVIATAIGGPLAGGAVKALAVALGLDESASRDDVMKAIVGATPDQLLALKKADQDFAVRMKELDINLERIAQEDRASARAREAATKDRMPAFIALSAIMGFFGILAMLVFHSVPESGADALKVMLGSLGTLVIAIGQYYFGSSSGSERKTELLAKNGH